MTKAPVPSTDKHKSKTKQVVSKVRQRTKSRYYTYMPNQKRHRIIVWVVFLVCALIIGAQLLYPPDRALPLVQLASKRVGWAKDEAIAASINEHFLQTKLRLSVGEKDKWIDSTLAVAGAEPAVEAMQKPLIEYPFWQRFVPLSIFAHVANVKTLPVEYNQRVQKQFADKQAAQLSFAPINARLAIKNGKLEAVADMRGSTVTGAAVESALKNATLSLGATNVVTVDATRTNPERTAADLEAVRHAAEAALARPVTIAAAGKTLKPDATTVATWLTIGNNEQGKAELQFDSGTFAKYMDQVDKEAGVPAGQTNIDLVNGHEVARQPGTTGTAVERTDLTEKTKAWLLAGQGNSSIAAVFVVTQPSIIYDKKYTSSQEGLQAYLDDVARRMDVHIAVQQVDGARWYASVRAGESIPSASTYKLYVAKWLFDQLDQGKTHWNDPMLDTTVSGCFDRMTIASTNPCAVAWLDQMGRDNMNNYVYGLGFSRGTTFTAPDATHSTTNDLMKMMLGINNGSLLSGANRDRLLHSLSTHPYRYGIPTGSRGQVWDKVGFLWDYVHDSAIVSHPKGTYVMVIMTKGQSYATIASLTREIEKIMYP